jgi:hypothetical protein
MTKRKCYDCKWRGEAPGSAHSMCEHPATAESRSDPMMSMLGILGKRMGVGVLPTTAAEKLNIRGNAHGILHGWFLWPMNFDPVWLENCDGFEARHEIAEMVSEP